MKVIAITKVHGTLNYLCMVQSKEGPVDWEFLPEVSLACPFRTISDAKRAINERFPPISGTTHAVQYVLVFSEPPSDKDSPLLQFLKTPVEDLLRKASNYQTPIPWALEHPLNPAKKDPTE